MSKFSVKQLTWLLSTPLIPYIESKITEFWLLNEEGGLLLLFLVMRAKLLPHNWSSGCLATAFAIEKLSLLGRKPILGLPAHFLLKGRHVQWAISRTRNEGSMFIQVGSFLVVDTWSVDTTITRTQNIQLCHSLRWVNKSICQRQINSRWLSAVIPQYLQRLSEVVPRRLNHS